MFRLISASSIFSSFIANLGVCRRPAHFSTFGRFHLLTALSILLVQLGMARGDERVLLWPNGAPLAVGETELDRPTLTCFPAKREVRDKPVAAVILMPGGGYTALATGHEGADCCRWLNERGIAGFVLRYRLTPRYQHPAPLLDGQRGVRWVPGERRTARCRSKPNWRLGGFSAGGHLASVTSTLDQGDPGASDPIDRVSCRPDLAILCYPHYLEGGAVRLHPLSLIRLESQ
ncbi:MAG: alpha/beta hydrolase [Planctomycetota bacterium]